jgi:zinc transport system substrate-binding protein
MNRRRFFLLALVLFLGTILPCFGARMYAPRLKVFVSIPPMLEAVSNIGGPRFEVSLLIPPGYTPENFSPNSRTFNDLSHAKALLTIGMPYEKALVSRLRQSMPQVRLFDMTDGMTFRDFPGHDGIPAPDPHVWLSIQNMECFALNAGKALAQLLPEEARDIQMRANVYVGKLRKLRAELVAIMAPLKGKTMLVTHPAFGYFAADFELRQLAVEREGKEPGPQELGEFIKLAQAENCRTLFFPLQHGDRLAYIVAKRISLTMDVKPLDPLPKAYLEGMKQLAEALQKGL